MCQHVNSILGSAFFGLLENTPRSSGFLYVGVKGSEIKVGMTRGCPFCRVERQQGYKLYAIAFTENVSKAEVELLRFLGDPISGKERFSKSVLPRTLIFGLKEVAVLESTLSERYG